MKVNFDFPISNTSKWGGELNVRALVDGQDAEIEQVIHIDYNGKKSDITLLVEEYAPQLYDSLRDAAVNDARNLELHEDYTLENQ